MTFPKSVPCTSQPVWTIDTVKRAGVNELLDDMFELLHFFAAALLTLIITPELLLLNDAAHA